MNAKRLEILKRDWPPEPCHKCWGDGCESCDKGTFRQRLDADWFPPDVGGGELVADIDGNEWVFVGIRYQDGREQELPFPFSGTGYATSTHMETIGFEVDCF